MTVIEDVRACIEPGDTVHTHTDNLLSYSSEKNSNMHLYLTTDFKFVEIIELAMYSLYLATYSYKFKVFMCL